MNNNLLAAANALKQLNNPTAKQTYTTTATQTQYQQAIASTTNIYQTVHNNMNLLCKQIREERQRLGWSQRKLAAASNTSQGTITRAECHGWCSMNVFMKIAIALNKQITIA